MDADLMAFIGHTAHLIRVQQYVRALCGELQKNPAYAETLTPAYVETLAGSVPMYDMGTVGIPDRILLKPGRLTPDEIAWKLDGNDLPNGRVIMAESLGADYLLPNG